MAFTGYFLRNIMINAILQKCRNVTKDDAENLHRSGNTGTEDEPEITMPGKLDIIKVMIYPKYVWTIQKKVSSSKTHVPCSGKRGCLSERNVWAALILDDNLAEGEYRMLTEEELKNLLF